MKLNRCSACFRSSPGSQSILSVCQINNIKGFTLLELLVVMVIIGLLAGYVGPKYFEQIGKSETKTARAQVDALGKALDQYRIDTGHYPTTEQGLAALNARAAAVHTSEASPLSPDELS